MPDPARNGHSPNGALHAVRGLCGQWCPVSCPRRTNPAAACAHGDSGAPQWDADALLDRLGAPGQLAAWHHGDTPPGDPGQISGEQRNDPAPDSGPGLDTVTAADLMRRTFPEPVWAVPGLVCEGVNLLAGAPKVGKSWLALNLALAVASGGRALGSIDVASGPVLYLALEDTPRRLQSRLTTALAGDTAPQALELATQAPALPAGAGLVACWLQERPAARLVIVDVFAKLRGTPPAGLSAYEADYRAVSLVKQLSDAHQVAIVLVHHTRKSGSGAGDFLEEVSGTNGLAGAADASLVLKRTRGTADAVLHATGRDVDESEHALTFAADLGTWQLLDGPAAQHTTGDTRAAILAHLTHNTPATPTQISKALDIPANTAKGTLRRMVADGQLSTDGNGRYHSPPDQAALQ